MFEVALYRKYRPQGWQDVLGQEHVVSVLKNAVAGGTIAHAYLFSGSRGTGKTSVARIFAKEIGTHPDDLYEIDAASNRGIDDVRALKEAVHTLPFGSKYKVYIIDEVHMLTKEAFNALLKTLEEPPKHVVFILATTETEKIPETVVSRCQTFTFFKPSQKVLRELILSIASREGFILDPSSADLIAILGDGSFRDTEGMLQKVLSSVSGKDVDPADVERVTGAPRGQSINTFIQALSEKDLPATLIALRTVAGAGLDMRVFLKLLLAKLRSVLLIRFAPELESSLAEEFSETDMAFLKEVANKKPSGISSSVLKEFLLAANDMQHAFVPELPVELALYRVLGQDNEAR